MEFKDYVQEVTATFLEKQNRRAIFIKHYNTLHISMEEMLTYAKNTGNMVYLYHEYAMNSMHSAYEPFLEWIRECYGRFYRERMTPEEFLAVCEVYRMHIEPLAGFLKDGRCQRTEDVLNFEIAYETSRMMESLISIFHYICKEHTLVFLLSKFHLAPCATIRLLCELMWEDMDFYVIVMYNDEFFIADYRKESWNELMEDVVRQHFELEWGRLDSERTIDMQDELWVDKNQMQDYFLKLWNMYHTFALKDALYYVNDIMYKLDRKMIRISPEDQMRLMMLAAVIQTAVGQFSQTLVTCDRMAVFNRGQRNDKYVEYQYYYIAGRARMYLAQMDTMRQYCKKCMDLAEQLGDELLKFKAEIMLWIGDSGIWKGIFDHDFRYNKKTEMVEKTRKFGFDNFLAFLYAFGFENDKESMRAIAKGEMEPVNFNRGIEIGERLGNESFLMMAYMKNIIMYSEEGYHRYVRKMYEKRLAVLRKPNPVRRAHMLAGMGYNSIILEDHEQATAYLVQSINGLVDLECPDDVMDSLYNLAMNYFVIESYDNVIEVLNLLLKMLGELDMQAIKVCNTTKLYGMLAVSYYYQEEYYYSYYYLSKIEVLIERLLRGTGKLSDVMWREDLLLYHLVKGMLYGHEEQWEPCQSEMDEVRRYLGSVTGDLFYIYPLFAMEQASVYWNNGLDDKADQVMQEAIDYCASEGFHRREKELRDFQETRNRKKNRIGIRIDELPVTKILQVTRQAGIQAKLKKRENDIDFIAALQETISRENLMTDELFQDFSAVLKSAYHLDDIIIIRKEGEKKQIFCGNAELTPDDQALMEIQSFFEEYGQPFLTNYIDKNFMMFLPILKQFDMERVISLIGIPMLEQPGLQMIFLASVNVQDDFVRSRVLLNGDDFRILKFAFSQFCETMTRILGRQTIERMNHELEQSAITDHLTGIFNRNGFSMQTDCICEDRSGRNNVLLYVDLDNFKFYNDTFGHDIGDLILVSFAKLFQRLTKDRGFAVRYGGDEFIIMLKDSCSRDGEGLAEQIYTEIRDGFREEISRKLKEEITIPENRRVSCSIGIATFRSGSREALEEALNRADQALYYIKKNGKSRYMVARE